MRRFVDPGVCQIVVDLGPIQRGAGLGRAHADDSYARVDVHPEQRAVADSLPRQRMLDAVIQARRWNGLVLATLAALMLCVPAHATSTGQPVRPVVRGKPVLTFDPNDLGAGLAVYVRFDREVPRRASGAPLVRVGINIADSAPTLEPLITAGRRERACYTNLRLEDSPARPRDRTLVKLLVDVGPRNAFKRYRFSVRVERLTPAPTRPSNNPILRRLGCVRG